jgi:hypothetical protein
MTDIFEQAARKKLRFASSVGDLTAEQLWDLPLTHKSRPSLNELAIATAKELRDLGDFSFVDVKPDPRKDVLTLQLAIQKRVIEVKMAEAALAQEASKRAERKQKILEALEKLEGNELAAKSRDELLAELNGL